MGLTLYPIICYIGCSVKLPNEFVIYGVLFVKTCSYRVVTVGSRYVVGSNWREHERDQPFIVRADCGLSGVCLHVQSGEFSQLTPRLGYNELWFIISDLMQPGNDVHYIRNSL